MEILFDVDSGQFRCENKGLIFVWDEQPAEDVRDVIDMFTENYYSHMDDIVHFMLTDLQQVYGDISVEIVKDKLGKPIIDYENGRVTYTEQSFDDIHIFEFEFLDDAFEKLQYFSIDG